MLLDYIMGRIEDYILTPDGKYIGRLDHIFKSAQHIRNAQIEQINKKKLIVRIVKSDYFNHAIEKNILKELRERIGNEMEVYFDYVLEIPKKSNGKYCFIIQRLDLKNMHIC